MKTLHKGLAGLVCGSLVLVSLPDGLAASTTTSRSQPVAQAAWITAAKTSQNARKPERDLIHFPVSKVYPKDAEVRVRTSERAFGNGWSSGSWSHSDRRLWPPYFWPYLLREQ